MTPTPITEWLCKDGRSKIAKGQAMYVRDCIHPLLARFEEREANRPTVIATHTSKSVKLPVIEVKVPSLDLAVVMRNNFYDWKVSVEYEDEVPDGFPATMFTRDKAWAHYYCEGFPEQRVYGPYSDNKGRFTLALDGSPMYPDFANGMLFAFCLILGEELR